MNVSTQKLKVVRLVTNEDYLANVVHDSARHLFILQNPLKVIHVINPDGSATLAVMKLSILSDDDWVEIEESKVLLVMNPNNEAKEYWGMSFQKQYENWAEEVAIKEKALKEFKELQSIAEGKEEEVEVEEEQPKVKKHRVRKNKPIVN